MEMSVNLYDKERWLLPTYIRVGGNDDIWRSSRRDASEMEQRKESRLESVAQKEEEKVGLSFLSIGRRIHIGPINRLTSDSLSPIEWKEHRQRTDLFLLCVVYTATRSR